MPDIWSPLLAELDRWSAAGRTACFWLRDDDAVEPTPALLRLLEVCGRHSVPATLAVIPSETGEELARYLDAWPLVNVAVHGWTHANHAGSGEKKQELGVHRPLNEVRAELQAGFRKLQSLHGERFVGLLVPPWNRIAHSVTAELRGLGFEALSVFGPEMDAPIPLINTHVDLMDWHGTRGARDFEALVSDIVMRVRQMHEGGGVMGFLTHHLVHDERAWQFVEMLLERTAGHPACSWASLPELLGKGRSNIDHLPLT